MWASASARPSVETHRPVLCQGARSPDSAVAAAVFARTRVMRKDPRSGEHGYRSGLVALDEAPDVVAMTVFQFRQIGAECLAKVGQSMLRRASRADLLAVFP